MLSVLGSGHAGEALQRAQMLTVLHRHWGSPGLTSTCLSSAFLIVGVVLSIVGRYFLHSHV